MRNEKAPVGWPNPSGDFGDIDAYWVCPPYSTIFGENSAICQ